MHVRLSESLMLLNTWCFSAGFLPHTIAVLIDIAAHAALVPNTLLSVRVMGTVPSWILEHAFNETPHSRVMRTELKSSLFISLTWIPSATTSTLTDHIGYIDDGNVK